MTDRPEAAYGPIFSFAWGVGDLVVAAGIVWIDMLQEKLSRDPLHTVQELDR